jgi:hypothetical protein
MPCEKLKGIDANLQVRKGSFSISHWLGNVSAFDFVGGEVSNE